MTMKAIYKYQIPAEPGRHEIRMPYDCRIISVQAQRDYISLWAIVWPDMTHVYPVGVNPHRMFRVVMTGEKFEPQLDARDQYLATVQFDGGAFVLHVFEEKP